MSLRARLERVERQLGLEGGGCAACCDWDLSFHVRYGTDEPLPPPEQCASSGRMRKQFVLIWGPPGAKEWLAQWRAQQTRVPLPPDAPAQTAEVLESGLPAASGIGSGHGSVSRHEAAEPARGAGAAREQPAAPLQAGAAGDRAVGEAGGAAAPTGASWERWPIFVAAYPIDVNGLHLRAGEPFPSQDKRDIRRYGPALGVPDAGQRPFHTLPYVTVRREWKSARPPHERQLRLIPPRT